VLSHPSATANAIPAKPILKWAGGKSQLLNELADVLPQSYGKYIEPFFGGGALFFATRPAEAVIADINPELVNLYRQVAGDPDAVVAELLTLENDSEIFYQIRELDWTKLEAAKAAARTIYLNRTCFNGLYRVNKRGEFNVPFGRYKNPRICNAEAIYAASAALQGVSIVHGDYKSVLLSHAKKGDCVFLDPPYLPVSEYADFKRYTKEQFYEEDHRELAAEVERLHKLGCHVILTNSNHPLVLELYEKFEITVHKTRRNISSTSDTRTGEDVIVVAKPEPRFSLRTVPTLIDERALKYPPTRYMGSKEKLLPYIKDVIENFEFESAMDLFSGSGVVGYLFKTMGKQVFSNDYMAMSATMARAMIENNDQVLSPAEIDRLFAKNDQTDFFVSSTFEDLYYSQPDNAVIDIVRSNIKTISNPHKRAIAMSALIRACLKKRARGIFTYTGLRYDDGRADLKLSMEEQVRNAAVLINEAVFDNGFQNKVRHGDALAVRFKPDLVYLDPPYFSELSDNEYVRRYHFVEGLARDWNGVDMQWHTKTKKFKSYPTPFSSRVGAHQAFDKLFKKFKDSIIVVSYSSNSLPTKDEIVHLIAKYKKHVEVVDIDYRYSFANQGHKRDDNKNSVKEYIFVGY
jgi:DNA adenine methylase